MSGVAIVTGGSRGIGRAAAILLAERGYDVVVNYQANAQAAAEVVDAINALGRQAVAVKGDVGVEADVLAIFAAADRLGPLKALVNNAGVIDTPARIDEMSVARLERMFRINMIGSFLCAREAVKRMSTRHGGQGGGIVNLSSAAAVLTAAGQYVDYAAAKAGIDVFTLGLAREVAAEGIRVNAGPARHHRHRHPCERRPARSRRADARPVADEARGHRARSGAGDRLAALGRSLLHQWRRAERHRRPLKAAPARSTGAFPLPHGLARGSQTGIVSASLGGGHDCAYCID